MFGRNPIIDIAIICHLTIYIGMPAYFFIKYRFRRMLNNKRFKKACNKTEKHEAAYNYYSSLSKEQQIDAARRFLEQAERDASISMNMHDEAARTAADQQYAFMDDCQMYMDTQQAYIDCQNYMDHNM